jgi:hypothetical protein
MDPALQNLKGLHTGLFVVYNQTPLALGQVQIQGIKATVENGDHLVLAAVTDAEGHHMGIVHMQGSDILQNLLTGCQAQNIMGLA